ncbi:MAG: hypothetical protein KZQ95_11285 [Candidatus Thiodiazotropha sp. (ex Epidulcina cf. delphinae)]|nr:hypothetical protein [Candidatus Thiodiazotropha sp. (ex Epidulcina cf. delphinae)]
MIIGAGLDKTGIMGPAGYRVSDFIRAGGIMTLHFLAVMMLVMNLAY